MMLHGGHPSRKRSGDCLKGKGCNAPCGRHCKRKDMIEAGNRWGESPSLRRDSSVRRQGADDGGGERCPAAQVRRIALDEICAAGVLSVGKT